MKKKWWILIILIAVIILIVSFIVIKNINTVECTTSTTGDSENTCVLPAPYESTEPKIRLGIFGKYFGIN